MTGVPTNEAANGIARNTFGAACLQAVESLEGVRLLVQDKLGSSSLLAERPGKRMAKHKSKAVSSSLAQRYCLVFGGTKLSCQHLYSYGQLHVRVYATRASLSMSMCLDDG